MLCRKVRFLMVRHAQLQYIVRHVSAPFASVSPVRVTVKWHAINLNLRHLSFEHYPSY